MAISHNEIQITFSGSPSDSVQVSAGGNQTSEEFNLSDNAVSAQVHLKADNGTTPAADDVIVVWLLQTLGDPDAEPDSADEFPTDELDGGLLLARLNTADGDPAYAIKPLPLPQKGCKLYFEGSTAGSTNAINVSATVIEQVAT